jgi:hypothetical protein
MNAPRSRHFCSSLNGRSVHAGLVGHVLHGDAVHMMVRIQIFAIERLASRRTLHYHV